MARLIAAIDVLPAHGNRNVNARDKVRARDGEVIPPHRNALKSPQPAGAWAQIGSNLSRRHIGHKHLAERHYAFEKIFQNRNRRS
jgi:hypothetical protein